MRTFLSLSVIFMCSVMLVFGLGCFCNYYYPVKYQAEIIEASKEANISPALLASIINVESGYKKDAVSNKGAVGLMQIMPETAEWVCQKIGWKYGEIDLKDEKTSIRLGAEYLSILNSSFSNQETMICAYNAGPTKVKSWLIQEAHSSDGKTLRSIPYKETSQYLNKVKKILRFYQHRYK